MADLKVDLAGLRLRNPLLLASGIWGESGESLAGAWEAGAGGVITKSIGRSARLGYPNPTVESLGRWGFLNAMGLPNPGIEEYPKEIAAAQARGATVIGSVFGGDADEYAELAYRMAGTGVGAIELNLSCPHAEGLGSDLGEDPQEVEAITRAVRARVSVPVIVKITPNTADPVALAQAAERGGASAISAINTLRAISIDVRLRRPTLSHGLGGLSGPAIKPVGLACVWQIYPKVSIPVVGVGGIRTAEDVLQYVMAGARAVEVGTAVALDGIQIFSKLSQDLLALMGELGIERIADVVGAAHIRPAVNGVPLAAASHERRP
ncbi:MAG: dihydroorotate dehydrogenase [Thermoplasmata archaeon]|nr:dihydroorotate dehydrogenase [Thermoplasmata archaeon]MCI4359832.1 dihydroorotate dehydrogenase [Thermoplasmata archaeon]